MSRIIQKDALRAADMIRIERSKLLLDISPNTIRSYGDEAKYGSNRLRIYKVGKATFVSRAEVEQFIRGQAEVAA